MKIFQIYTGIGVGTDNSFGLCSRVVLGLMRVLETSGVQTITILSYFYNHLYNLGISACGTVRVNRQQFPKDLTTKPTLQNYTFYVYRSNGPFASSSMSGQTEYLFCFYLSLG